MNCSECNNTLAESATSCPFCGAPVEPVNFQHQATKFRRIFTGISEKISMGSKLLMGELKVRPTEQTEAELDQLKLWNPLVIAILEIPFLGLLCASGLVALNWQRLKQPRLARLAWYGGPVIFIAVLLIEYFGHLELSALAWSIWSFLTWFVVLGLPQILHVRKHVVGYQRQRWILPIGLGIVIGILVTFITAKV